ncbi:glutamate--tRNA ligase [Candidatus Woesearchaeota archaeon]|nr:glutamate--tRNA ligase [Candidatus Woesearchaeota archaeon]
MKETSSSNGKDIILKYALQNAHDFGGKVNVQAVLGSVLREKPELKKDVPKALKEIQNIAKEVQQLSPAAQQEKLKSLAPELLQKAEKKAEGPLKPLPKAVPGKVSLRIAPSPSGLLHIGHIYGTSLNYEYAKMYNGKFSMRIEDTDPEKIYPPAYDLIVDDAQWLTDNGVSEVVVQSSRLGIYYDYAEKLVTLGKAYICTCDADKWREMKNRGTACGCRSLAVKEQQLRYAKMFNEYAEGEAVLRLKTDIAHKNPAMRDFGIMRINEHVHPKTGKEQRVWPLMVFSVAIDDHELGITHVLNGKEHADNALKEQIIMEYLGWKPPVYGHWGRINFSGFSVSKSKTRLAIEEGQYKGWDDIRLPFLQALRRRGYQAPAFRRFAIEIGLSLNDKTVSMEEFWKMINAFNREIIEPRANRYFFVDDPVEITIESCPPREVHVPLHPDFPERGKRTLQATDTFLIAKNDYRQLAEGYVHRLMDCCNFMLKGTTFHYLSQPYDDYRNAKDQGRIIHWLPAATKLQAEVLLDTGLTLSGVAEEALQKLPVGTIVQLERRFFARIDTITKNKITLWYLHK